MSAARRKRPEVLPGSTKIYKLACSNKAKFYITISGDGVYTEVLTDMKMSQCYKIYLEAVSRLINLSFRKGASIEEVMDELSDLNCGMGISCPHIIATELKVYAQTVTERDRLKKEKLDADTTSTAEK